MSQVNKNGFYGWSYYSYLFRYVIMKETGALFRLIGLNFILALLPIIILTIKSSWYLPDQRIHFFGDAAIIIFCTTVLITTLFKIVVNENEDLKPFKSSMSIILLIAYGFGLWLYIEYKSVLNTDWQDFFHLCWISTLFLLLTFFIVFFVHFTETIDFKGDVEPFIEKRKRAKLAKKAENKSKSKTGDEV